MNRIHFINFGTPNYAHRQMLQLLSAKMAGKADVVRGFYPSCLKKLGFYETRPWVRSSQRGFAFWSWKPFIIQHELQGMQDGDILIYSDIGRPWVRMFSHSFSGIQVWLEELAQDVMPGIYIPDTGTMANWTKETTLRKMNACSRHIRESVPVQTSFSVWRKTRFSLELVKEWEEKAQDVSLIGDYDPEIDLPNNPAFIDHRHDQAVFSILCLQHHVRASCMFRGERPLLDKDMDAWLGVLGHSRTGSRMNWFLNGISAGVRKMEHVARACGIK